MGISKVVVAMSALFLALPSYGYTLQVREFQALPPGQQRQIVEVSYNAVSSALAFANTKATGSPAAKKFTSCLRTGDTDWAVGAVSEYFDGHVFKATSLGDAITQAMMWKCGVLIFVK